MQLPIFPEGVTLVTQELGFYRRDGKVVYVNGQMPVFVHEENDVTTFRMITSQFVVNGNASQAEISRAFGIPKITVKRYVKLYREHGPKGFYAPRRHRGASVLTPEVLSEAQKLLDEGRSLRDVGIELSVRTNTLNKAVHSGKLQRRPEKKHHRQMGS